MKLNALIEIGTGAGAILLAALVIGIFQALLSLRDNSRAIKSLDKTIGEFKTSVDGSMANLITRTENLERWRIAVEARSGTAHVD